MGGVKEIVQAVIAFLIEVVLSREMFKALHGTLELHKTFADYLDALLQLQNFHATALDFDNFYMLTQQEEEYKWEYQNA